MAESGRPEQRSREQWAALVKEHEASGQSQRAFCAARGIGQSTLRYWRRRLQEDGLDGEGGVGARLVAVRVREEAPVEGLSGVSLVAGGGLRIELAPGFDATTLQRVLRTLGAGA
jgi:transposase-like protein